MNNIEQQIQAINNWAIANPDKIFEDNFREQRKYLTNDTWNTIYPKLNIKFGDKRMKMIPTHIQSKIFNEGVSKSIDNSGKVVLPSIAAAVAAPYAIGVASKVAANPIAQKIFDVLGTVDGVKNLASNNGVKKTIRETKSGNYGKAALSLTGDLLDVTGGLGLANRTMRKANALRKYLTYNKTYTGIPNTKIRGTNITMVNHFPYYEGTVWTANSPDYARSFSGEKGKIYTIYGKKSNNMLTVPESKIPMDWASLPYELENDKLIRAKTPIIRNYKILTKKDNQIKYKDTDIISGGSPNALSTDELVEYSKRKNYDGTIINNVEDGASTSDKYYPFFENGKVYETNSYTEPINEIIYNSNKNIIKIPYGTSFWKTLRLLESHKSGGKIKLKDKNMIKEISDKYGVSKNLDGSVNFPIYKKIK